ncbi:stromelysin-3-like isoform X3 [Anarrhichthys ocellatus]|uniref:stromelysin-3-like isoform X3 n=1 Tax=Anarrhichthys ocellatus TaxID=433405 RepID=UPI0012ECF3DF|nr:stromelysin-3-like isoform X3 [Anarrhichthys ocellatus]
MSKRLLSWSCCMSSSSMVSPLTWSLTGALSLRKCSGESSAHSLGPQPACLLDSIHNLTSKNQEMETVLGLQASIVLGPAAPVGGVCPQHPHQLCYWNVPVPVCLRFPTSTVFCPGEGGFLSICPGLRSPLPYWHGDSLPFDGPGGILAHAFFPRTNQEGEVHFDYDENWTVGSIVGTDLAQVATHEFGHVLGLQHSLEPDAVMCPFYSDSYPLQLSEDDKRGIQYLYGPPLHAQPEMTETNEIDIGMLDACRTNFDAVSMIRGELFFFKSRYVWRIRDGQLQAGYPALASRHWRGIPDYIDAAYEDKSGNIWFFQGDSYWVFDAERKITGPDSVRQLGLPVTDIQAALKWEEDRVEKVYIFKLASYWPFNPQVNRVDDVHPRSMHKWGGVPGHIDAAFRDLYGYANFLSGLHYWKFDPVALKVLEGYPRSIGMDFFGCSAFLSK